MELAAKIEQAFQLVLRDLVTGTDYNDLWIGRGIEAEEMPVPRVVFHCYNFQEEPDQTGNGFCDVVMTIRSSSDRHDDSEDPAGAHNALVKAAAEIWRDDLAEMLSDAVDELTVEEEMESLPGTRRTENRCFVTEQRIRVYAYNVALTD